MEDHHEHGEMLEVEVYYFRLRRHHEHPAKADGIVLVFCGRPRKLRTGECMTQAGNVGQTVSVVGAAAVGGDPTKTKAVLSNQVFTSSDSAVFTVAPDPAVPGGAIITFVAPGTATLTETATATDPDGVNFQGAPGNPVNTPYGAQPGSPVNAAYGAQQVQGVATIVTNGAGVPGGVADSIAFTFGVPTP